MPGAEDGTQAADAPATALSRLTAAGFLTALTVVSRLSADVASVDDFSEIIDERQSAARIESVTSRSLQMIDVRIRGLNPSIGSQTRFLRGLGSIPRRWLRVKRRIAKGDLDAQKLL